METIQQHDEVILKDGRRGCAVEVFDQDAFLVDVGSSPVDWETIEAKRDDIIEVIHHT